MKKVLYLSYDGLTDPLGQSQVIPYLQGLAKHGHKITIVSFEKKEREGQKEKIGDLLAQHLIDWVPLPYTKKPPVFSTLFDLLKLRKVSKYLILKKGIEIVHCRSYLTALVGHGAKKKFGTRFIFDMRGFWADERVEGGLWDLGNPMYKVIFNFFKRKEKELLEGADFTITLTYKAKDIIHSWSDVKNNPIPITVIPCCVDLELFNPSKIREIDVVHLRQKLNIAENEYVLMYLGSVGTWYMLDEMLCFFKVLKERQRNARFLFVTTEPKELIERAAEKAGIEKEAILVASAKRDEVPLYILLSSACIYFINPVFSKQASSPTKHGEILAMGKPIITNSGVGDWEVLRSYGNVFIVNKLDKKGFNSAVQGVLKDRFKKSGSKNELTQNFFNLEEGINKYNSIYLK